MSYHDINIRQNTAGSDVLIAQVLKSRWDVLRGPWTVIDGQTSYLVIGVGGGRKG
jgi:hypothetical protein